MVYAISPEEELRWGAHLLMPGIGSGVHVFLEHGFVQTNEALKRHVERAA